VVVVVGEKRLSRKWFRSGVVALFLVRELNENKAKQNKKQKETKILKPTFILDIYPKFTVFLG